MKWNSYIGFTSKAISKLLTALKEYLVTVILEYIDKSI